MNKNKQQKIKLIFKNVKKNLELIASEIFWGIPSEKKTSFDSIKII
jgi:hypothetical protein